MLFLLDKSARGGGCSPGLVWSPGMPRTLPTLTRYPQTSPANGNKPQSSHSVLLPGWSWSRRRPRRRSSSMARRTLAFFVPIGFCAGLTKDSTKSCTHSGRVHQPGPSRITRRCRPSRPSTAHRRSVRRDGFRPHAVTKRSAARASGINFCCWCVSDMLRG
jgi:hypothetical protein